MTGGGARAAYQVGVLKAISEILPKGASSPFPVISGTSAGAINAMTQLMDENPLPSDFTLPQSSAGEIRGLLNRYMCNLLGHRPKTQELLS